MDVYNAGNASSILSNNLTYGSNWLRPTADPAGPAGEVRRHNGTSRAPLTSDRLVRARRFTKTRDPRSRTKSTGFFVSFVPSTMNRPLECGTYATGDQPMRRVLTAFLLALLGAQARPPAPASVRLYVFDCGTLKIADPMPLFGLKKEEVGATNLSDAAYLIVHPRGTLMWDAGFLPDSDHRVRRAADGHGPREQDAQGPARAGRLQARGHHLPRAVPLPRRSHRQRQRLQDVHVARDQGRARRDVHRTAPADRIAGHLQRAQGQQDGVRAAPKRLRRLRRRHRRHQADAGPHAGPPGPRGEAGEDGQRHAHGRHVSLPGRG